MRFKEKGSKAGFPGFGGVSAVVGCKDTELTGWPRGIA
jgi:hypothetical protein